MSVRERLRIGFDVLILCVFAFTAWEALSFSRLARYMPLYVSVAGLVLTVALIGIDVLRARSVESRPVPRQRAGFEDYSEERPVSGEGEVERLRLTVWYLGWLVGFVGLIALVGVPVASAVFLGAFLRFDARMGVPGIAISISATLGGLWLVTYFMHVRWPSSLIGW